MNATGRTWIKDRQGVAAIEFAIVAPVLLMMLAGITDFGLIRTGKSQMANGVAQGIEYALLQGPSVTAAICHFHDPGWSNPCRSDQYSDRGRDWARVLLRHWFSGRAGHTLRRVVRQFHLHEHVHRAGGSGSPFHDRHSELHLSAIAAVL